MTFFACKSEAYYVKKLLFIQKECWKSNMNKQESSGYMIKYLNKKRFNIKKHPFISDFKKKLNAVNGYKAEAELNEILASLQRYKLQLKKNCLNVV